MQMRATMEFILLLPQSVGKLMGVYLFVSILSRVYLVKAD